jgi:hypothetical protein
MLSAFERRLPVANHRHLYEDETCALSSSSRVQIRRLSSVGSAKPNRKGAVGPHPICSAQEILGIVTIDRNCIAVGCLNLNEPTFFRYPCPAFPVGHNIRRSSTGPGLCGRPNRGHEASLRVPVPHLIPFQTRHVSNREGYQRQKNRHPQT